MAGGPVRMNLAFSPRPFPLSYKGQRHALFKYSRLSSQIRNVGKNMCPLRGGRRGLGLCVCVLGGGRREPSSWESVLDKWLSEGKLSHGDGCPQACLREQGYRKGKPRNVDSLAVMSSLVGGRYFAHFMALLAPGLLDRGDQLIINCLLRVAFQILARIARSRVLIPPTHWAMAGPLPSCSGRGTFP